MSTEPMIKAWEASGLKGAIQRAGLSPDQVLRDAGLNPDTLNDPENWIPLRQFNEVLELAAQRSGDDSFGLRLGATINPAEFGVIGHVALNSPNVEAAWANIIRFINIGIETLEASLRTVGDTARLSFLFTDPSVSDCRHQIERLACQAVHFIRWVSDPDWRPSVVHFRHQPPADVSEYQRLFGAPVLFDQIADAIEFERSILIRPIQKADSYLLRVLERHAEDMLAALPASDNFVATLSKNISDELRNGYPDIEHASKKLGMSSRTLRRRLRDQSITYSGLVNKIRYDLSQRYLEDKSLTIKEISFLLGYSDVSAFNRAYKRWSGMPPIAYRRRANVKAR